MSLVLSSSFYAKPGQGLSSNCNDHEGIPLYFFKKHTHTTFDPSPDKNVSLHAAVLFLSNNLSWLLWGQVGVDDERHNEHSD
jgi:hypothetical protein